MMPAYSYMDSNSFNQVPYPQYHHPGIQAVPYHMMVDPSKPPVLYESPPYSTNFGCSFPCHAYHNNCIPGHYNYVPCPHFQPLPQDPCCGYHPPFPDAYPVSHVHTPYYLREQPIYEYGKKVWPSEYHCCGCPDHKSNFKNDKAVKMEEAYSETQNENRYDSVFPVQLKNCQYPIVWFPPEYLKNRGNLNPSNSNIVSVNGEQPNTRPPENVRAFKWDPRFLNGWFPSDLNNTRPSMQVEDGQRDEGRQNKNRDNVGQFPFPVIWIPNESTQVKDRTERELAAPPIFSEEPSSEPISATVNLHNDDGPKEPLTDKLNSRSKDDSEMVGQIPIQKSIPVKQMESIKEEENSVDAERKGRSVAMKRREENADVGKLVGTTTRKQSSPPKTSKLPPVCLRVDPFPGKKVGSGSSRSPSPPSSKGQSQSILKDTSKDSSCSRGNQSGILESTGSDASSGWQRKIIKVEEMKPKENKDVRTMTENQGSNFSVDSDIKCSANSEVEVPVGSAVLKNTGQDGHDSQLKEDKRAQSAEVLKLEEMESNKIRDSAESADGVWAKKKFSDIEAAMVIQSAYRGFEVRKWAALKKLKQMALVREQVTDIRNRICLLETSTDHQKDERERVVVGEMIMNLLLKLDTIQGLHPSLRDIRKSLARELITLQEKLDSLAKSPEKLPSDVPCSITGLPEERNEEAGLLEDSSGTCYQNSYVDTNQGQVSQTVDASSSPEGEFGKLDAQSNVDTDLPAVREVQQKATEGAPNSESVDGAGGGQLYSKLVTVETQQQRGFDEVQTLLHPWDLEEENLDRVSGNLCDDVGNDSVKDSQSKVMDANSTMDLDDSPNVKTLEELPQGVLDEEASIPEYAKRENGAAENVTYDGEMEPNASLNVQLPGVQLAGNNLNANMSAELPLVAIDESDGHLNPEMVKDETGQKEHNLEINVAFTPAILNQKELQRNASLNEMAPLAEQEDWASLGKKIDNICGDAIHKVEEKEQQELDATNDSNQEAMFQGEGMQQGSPVDCNEGYEERDGGRVIHVNESEFSEYVDGITAPQERKIEIEMRCQVAAGCDIKKEGQEHVAEFTDHHHEKMANQSNGYEIQEQLLDGKVVNPEWLEPTKEEREVATVTSTVSELLKTEEGTAMESNRRLMEENEKLREMMEKLMEAGKDQLNVISNLSGRVKDLERKLARKKKKRTRHC